MMQQDCDNYTRYNSQRSPSIRRNGPRQSGLTMPAAGSQRRVSGPPPISALQSARNFVIMQPQRTLKLLCSAHLILSYYPVSPFLRTFNHRRCLRPPFV